jgi:hypothetical protein
VIEITLTLLRCGEDRPGQLGMRLGRLGGHDDLGPVLGRLERDGLADAAARARDVERLPGQLPARLKRLTCFSTCQKSPTYPVLIIVAFLVEWPLSDAAAVVRRRCLRRCCFLLAEDR